MFAASSGTLSMSHGSGKLLNTSYLPNKVEDAIFSMARYESTRNRGNPRYAKGQSQIISSFENNNKRPQCRMGETGPLNYNYKWRGKVDKVCIRARYSWLIRGQ